MLPSQRDQFDIPRDICYLNAASWSPLPLATQEAGRAAVGRKGQPWKIDPGFAGEQHERARKAAARLINAEPEDVALISSVSYGVATAAKCLSVPKGARVLLLQDDHSSPALEWMTRAPAEGYATETVAQPADGDWTSAVLAAIDRKGAAPVALASISSLHWSDGGGIDLDRVAAALRKQGAALLVDGTQGVGAVPFDVRSLDPDFLVFPTYKWTLGPYGRAFIYIAKRRQDGQPLEQTGFGRRSVAAERAPPYLKDTAYVDGARRFDMGERDHFISLEMAAIGMEMVDRWGADAIARRLRMLTDRLADGLRNSGVLMLDDKYRVPHILSLAFPKGMPADLVQRLAKDKVYAAPRLGRLRISPHVYNDEEDVDRFIEVFRKAFV
ncbi:MAG: aminotransferase class V-fold PLP-dependent enzyme [Alphaproteobacteria bacterium]|nr:aminotransferase class V-fold PLP-dependent enzyme [Alphaproteobacteria bacterium]